jgi:creatinine amidohydrolase
VRLGELSTEALAALLAGPRPVVALLPVGSVEPHGPHLPLQTDTLISEGAILRACARLSERVQPVVAPAVPYGVTHYARGFAGAVSVPQAVLTAYLRAVVEGLLGEGLAHVCIVNNHLEPEHDQAVRAALEGLPRGRASVACPLTRRWARTLGDEFKRGECHAGRYETSLLLACAPGQVDGDAARALPEVPVSLSKKISEGVVTFTGMGLHRAYAGAPAQASAEEGEALLEKLAEMIATEISESMDSNVSGGSR